MITEDKYYQPDFIEELECAVSEAEDAFKYLVMCRRHPDVAPKDSDKLTPELIEEFTNLRGACADFIKVFDFYESELREDLF